MLGIHQRGDTIVEVMVALAVFTLVAVGAVAIMNRGIAMTERSLEITLVREQIDAQAEILRFARDTEASAWTDDILTNLSSASGDACPDTPPAGAFIASVSSTGEVTYTRFSGAPGSFEQPTTYSQFTIDNVPTAYGMWVVPLRVDGATNAYDMHIRACWLAPGESAPTTLGTIVRLYET